jgi:histidine ammonia-lyase
VLAIETLCAARALDLLAPLRTGPILEEVRTRIRKVSPQIEAGRPFYGEIAALEGLIAAGALRL